MVNNYEQLISVCNTSSTNEATIRDVFDNNIEFVEHRGIDVLCYHAAQSKDNSSILRMLLTWYPKIALRTFKRKHILYYALIADMCANVDMLLRYFTYNWVYDPNRPCDKSVFHIAARLKLSERMSDVIINYMATVDWYQIFTETVPDEMYGRLEVLGILVKFGNIHFLSRLFLFADRMLSRVTFQNDTLLHMAVRRRQFGCVRFLLANVPSLCTRLNKHYHSPLGIAAQNQDLELVELLACFDPDMIYRTGSNVFSDAISRGFVSVVKLLLAYIPKDVCWKKDVWWNVNDVAMVEFLLEVDPTLVDYIDDDCGRNPLHILVSRRRYSSAIINLLLTRKPSMINDVDQYSKKTPIELACNNFVRNRYGIRAMIECCPTLSFVDNIQNTTLHLAVKTSHNRARLMSVYNANPECLLKCNECGQTPYYLAVDYNNLVAMDIFESIVPFDLVFTTYTECDKNMEDLLQRVVSLFDNNYLLPTLHTIVFEYLGFTSIAIRKEEKKTVQKNVSCEQIKKKMDEFLRGVPRLPRINIRVQQRNGKKSITSIEGLPFDLDLKKLLRHLRKHLATNGTVIMTQEIGNVIYERIIQLQGDKREETARFLIDHNICSKDDIWIHGPI